jgi:hypothetical protein
MEMDIRIHNGEKLTVGDIYIFPFSEVRKLSSLEIGDKTRQLLVRQLQSNSEPNNRGGLAVTGSSLNESIENLRNSLEMAVSQLYSKSNTDLKVKHRYVQQTIQSIREWFIENYDDKRYKYRLWLPAPLAGPMGVRLEEWLHGRSDLSEPIEEVLREGCEREGIKHHRLTCYQMWKRLSK